MSVPGLRRHIARRRRSSPEREQDHPAQQRRKYRRLPGQPRASEVARVIAAAGGICELARSLDLRVATIAEWPRVPAQHVLTIEHKFGIARDELRPDLAGIDLRPAPPRVYPPPVALALTTAGSPSKLARLLGISATCFKNWRYLPSRHIAKPEQALGLSRVELESGRRSPIRFVSAAEQRAQDEARREAWARRQRALRGEYEYPPRGNISINPRRDSPGKWVAAWVDISGRRHQKNFDGKGEAETFARQLLGVAPAPIDQPRSAPATGGVRGHGARVR